MPSSVLVGIDDTWKKNLPPLMFHHLKKRDPLDINFLSNRQRSISGNLGQPR